MKWPIRPSRTNLVLSIILAAVAVLSLFYAWNDSQTIDEAAHLGAGYSYIHTADFRLNPEHPPLMKLLAGLALAPVKLTPVRQVKGWSHADQWQFGKNLVYHSPTNYRKILFVARLPFITIFLLTIWAVFRLGKRLFNTKVGLIAAIFVGFDPTMFAHGHLVTNDMLLTLMVVLYAWSFYNYMKRPNSTAFRVLILATLGVLSAKYNGVVVVPFAAGLIVNKNWQHKTRAVGKIAVAAILVFVGIWAQYFFTTTTISREMSATSSIYSSQSEHPEYAATSSRVDNLTRRHSFLKPLVKIPIPAFPYLKGITNVLIHSQSGRGAYLLGNYSDRGWPYYMPLLTLFKLPTFVLGLLLGLLILVWQKRSKWRDARVLCLILPPLTLFAISALSSINIGVRHVLPTWAFIYLLIALGLTRLKLKYIRIIVAIIVVANIVSLPTALAYQNLASRAVAAVINKPVAIDSNLDWGQDMYRLHDYLVANKPKSVGLALFTNADVAQVLGAKTCELDEQKPQCAGSVTLPTEFIVSDTARYIEPNSYNWLDKYPSHRLGGSLSVYDIKQ